MAKKSKRPPARKQPPRRPQTRPAFPQHTAPDALLDAAPLDDELQDDYAAGALPVTESDGPMPLPPAERPPQVAAAVSTGTAEQRRRIGRVDPAQTGTGQRAAQQRGRSGGRTLSTAAMFEPLPPEDAAIPFDRVPYVPGDLRRVLIIAAVMIVLIVVADIVVNSVVK